MWIRQKRAAVAGLAMAVTAVGFAAPSLAAADTVLADPVQATEPTVAIVENDGHADDGPIAEDGDAVSCEAYFDGEFAEGDGEDWVPSPEELAEINAETDDLVAFLAENGVSVEVETDDLGFRFPAFDEDTDDSVFDLVDQFFAERYGDEWVPSPEELAEVNAETDDLVAFLAENGVSVELETDDLGFRFPAFDEDTDDSVFDLVDQFFVERYGDDGWLIDEAGLGEAECFFDDAEYDDAEYNDAEHDDAEYDDGEWNEGDAIDELELSSDELAELAEEFGIEVEDLAELIELLIG